MFFTFKLTLLYNKYSEIWFVCFFMLHCSAKQSICCSNFDAKTNYFFQIIKTKAKKQKREFLFEKNENQTQLININCNLLFLRVKPQTKPKLFIIIIPYILFV